MSIMSDRTIKNMCYGDKPMIYPFFKDQVCEQEYNATDEEIEICRRYTSAKAAMVELLELDRTCIDVRNDPLLGYQIRKKIISYGLSSYGYDVRLGDEYKVFTNINGSTIDPLNFDPQCYVDRKGPFQIIPPKSFILAGTMERVRIPRDVLVMCIGKSTYARTGMIVNVTPLEPEWEGVVTLELSNTTELPLKVYAGMGIAQFVFMTGDLPCDVSYADRKGKYQNQTGVTPPKV